MQSCSVLCVSRSVSVWLGKLACIEPIKAVRPKPASIMETALQLKVEGLVMKDLRMKDMVVANKKEVDKTINPLFIKDEQVGTRLRVAIRLTPELSREITKAACTRPTIDDLLLEFFLPGIEDRVR